MVATNFSIASYPNPKLHLRPGSLRGRSKVAARQDMLSHTGLKHGAAHLEPSSDAARRAKRAPRQHPYRRWGLGLNSRSIRIVLLDAIAIRRALNAVFGTGFGSVFPKLKC